MILIRFILIFLIVYLLLRGFIKSLSTGDSDTGTKNKQKFRYKAETPKKKVSKSIGEYVDYEETSKKD